MHMWWVCVSDLEKNSAYHVRVQAQNVNGSGPATNWITATTFANDLIGLFT